nr:MAG TPA: hypothetical protein [Caudoviricetes sp.]
MLDFFADQRIDRTLNIEVENHATLHAVDKLRSATTIHIIDTEVDIIVSLGVLGIIVPTHMLTSLRRIKSKSLIDFIQEYISSCLENMIPIVELTIDEEEIQFRILLPIIIELIENASIDRRNTTIRKNGNLFLGLLLLTGFGINGLLFDLLFHEAIAKFFVDLVAIAIADILTILLESLIEKLIGRRQRSITLGENLVAIENRGDAKSTNAHGRSVELNDLPSSHTDQDLLICIGEFTGIGATIFQLTADRILDVLFHGLVIFHDFCDLKSRLASHNGRCHTKRNTNAGENLRRILPNEELRPIKNRLCGVCNCLSREFHCAFTLS